MRKPCPNLRFKPDKHLINEMLWDGYTLDEIIEATPLRSVEMIEAALFRPAMNIEHCRLIDRMQSHNYELGFIRMTNRERRQAEETENYRIDRMKKNKFYDDSFVWDRFKDFSLIEWASVEPISNYGSAFNPDDYERAFNALPESTRFIIDKRTGLTPEDVIQNRYILQMQSSICQ